METIKDKNAGIKSIRVRIETWQKIKQVSLDNNKQMIDLVDDLLNERLIDMKDRRFFPTKELEKGE